MVVGRPFALGHDERRGKTLPPPKLKGETPLPKYIREKTRRGRALVEWLVAIADGTAEAKRQVSDKEGNVVDLVDHPTHRERLAAIRELWDRGLGTAIPQDKMPTPPEPEREETDGSASLEPPPMTGGDGDAGTPGDGNGGGA